MALDRYSTGMASKSQVEGAILGVFFAFNTALYSTSCCTHTKTAEPIMMPFGMMSVLGPSNNVPTYFFRITVCDESPDPTTGVNGARCLPPLNPNVAVTRRFPQS